MNLYIAKTPQWKNDAVRFHCPKFSSCDNLVLLGKSFVLALKNIKGILTCLDRFFIHNV